MYHSKILSFFILFSSVTGTFDPAPSQSSPEDQWSEDKNLALQPLRRGAQDAFGEAIAVADVTTLKMEHVGTMFGDFGIEVVIVGYSRYM